VLRDADGRARPAMTGSGIGGRAQVPLTQTATRRCADGLV